MPHPDERHYKPEDLAKFFAVASLILLGALGIMLMKDYDRGWKKYQKEFRALEIEKTRVKMDGVEHQLADNAEYQALLEELAKARTEFEKNCGLMDDKKAELESLRAENDLVNQRFRFTRAELDAAKYNYEEALNHGTGDLAKTREIYQTLVNREKKLKLAVEKSDSGLKERQAAVDACGENLKELDRQERKTAQQKYILERKLAKIDPLSRSVINQIADGVRDLPILDLANPTYKIEQIVLKDVPEDMIFTDVPRVDRCTTCHLGIANPDYKDMAQPYRTHPNLELYIDKDSPHPIDDFGCTVCHNGRGRGTDFTSAAHTPATPEQAAEWKKTHGWHRIHHWETPMFPAPYTEAGCFKCHSGETSVRGADKLNLGLNIIERAGCYACHDIEKYEDWPKPGPDLTKLAAKFDKDWAYNWISDPRAFRHNTWMPSFFGQSNNSDPDSVARSQQEILSIVHYLYNANAEFKLTEMPNWGDPVRGEELVKSVGCMGCHNIMPEPDRAPATLQTMRKEQGPNLIGLGTKTSKAWLYNWLKDPVRYHSSTRMPSLRLSNQEAADIAAFLTKDKATEFAGHPVPAVNDDVLNRIVLDLLQKNMTEAQAANTLVPMSRDEKLDFTGKKMIAQYGCYSCHNISGFENFKPIGTDLTEEGSKPANKLDFGFVHIDHTNLAWFTQKLKDPRSFDHGRVRAPDEKLRMPNYYFTDQEIEAVVTALMGFVKEKPEAKMKPRTARNLQIEEGQKLVREFNCQGCHMIEGQGGAIQPDVINWMVQYDSRAQSEAEALVASFSPPDLIGEGKKVQTEWLFNFLHSPNIIRPWLKVRMPTYNFHTDELNAFTKYFAALDDASFPFSDNIDNELKDADLIKTGHVLFSEDYFNCAQCHIVGSQMPGGSPENWAPDFALAKSRLRPAWLIEWIKDPQSLLPGTKMPTYFDPQYFEESGPNDILDGDETRQIRALRNFIMTLADHPEQAAKTVRTPSAAPVVPPVPAVEPAPTPAAPPADASGQ